jgi:ribonuclease HIII
MAQSRLDALRLYIAAQGWAWQPGKAIPHGEQIVVTAGEERATATHYPKSGAVVIGGPTSPLHAALSAWAATAPVAAPAPRTPDAGPGALPLPLIGMDESGKGDWFGPLVIAAVRVDAPTAAALHTAGVRDSKTIPGSALGRLVTVIEQHVPSTHRQVVVIAPETYNALYAQHANVNVLLADAYARAAAPVVRATGTRTILCDQFSSVPERLENAFAARGLPRPHQQPRAEAASVAVAAASILATAAFSMELEELGRAAGLGRALPQGAMDRAVLEATVRQLVRELGRDAVGRYAKLHFKPVHQLLADLANRP